MKPHNKRRAYRALSIFFALVGATGFAVALLAQELAPPYMGERTITVSGTVAGEKRDWLRIEAHNGREFGERGFDPSYTRAVCDYKPIVRKLADGRFEIQFTSEIAESLP